MAAQAAPVAHAPWILYSASNVKNRAGAGRLHGQFHEKPLLPARSRYAPSCPSGLAALRCRSVPLQISVPSAAAQWMQLDVLAACLLDGRFVLECLE